MDTETPPRKMTPQQFDDFMTTAKARAVASRAEAIDDLLSHVSAGVRRLWQALWSATRAARSNPNPEKQTRPR